MSRQIGPASYFMHSSLEAQNGLPPGFSTSQDELARPSQRLGLGAAYLGLVLTRQTKTSGQDLDKPWSCLISLVKAVFRR
jgi:hypothetical protein